MPKVPAILPRRGASSPRSFALLALLSLLAGCKDTPPPAAPASEPLTEPERPVVDTPIKKAPRPIIGALRAPLDKLPQVENFELVGYNPLPNPGDTRPRGSNGPTAVSGDCLYVGVFPNLFFISWYSGGLRAWDISNPVLPLEVGVYVPKPATDVVEPFRNSPDVWFWSQPLLYNGHLYVADINSGVYILRYKGDRADEVPQQGLHLSNTNF